MASDLTVPLRPDTLERLNVKAASLKMKPEDLARLLVEQVLFDEVAREESHPRVRESATDYGGDGPTRPWDEVRPEMEALIDRTFGKE